MRKLPLVALILAWLTLLPCRADVLDGDGVHIYYTVQGTGSPLILVHGYTGNGFWNWTAPGITAALAKNHRVVVLDVRGHGRSDRPTDPAQYGLHMVEDVVRLMNHLGMKKADVMGYSMGGMIALKLASLYPDRVHSVILGGMGWVRPEVGAAISRTRGQTGALAACRQSWGQLALTRSELAAVHTPMAVIVGEDDRLVRRLYVDPLIAARPDVPVSYVPGAGHLGAFAKPEFMQAVYRFNFGRGGG